MKYGVIPSNILERLALAAGKVPAEAPPPGRIAGQPVLQLRAVRRTPPPKALDMTLQVASLGDSATT